MTKRTALYRHYDGAGRLLYVGITDCFAQRDRQHLVDSYWHADVRQSVIVWYQTREAALIAERCAIGVENPVYNVMHRQGGNAKPISGLIARWPNRQALADDIDANIEAVHKWAKSDRIPSGWMLAVVNAAQSRGFEDVTAEWMITAHSDEVA